MSGTNSGTSVTQPSAAAPTPLAEIEAGIADELAAVRSHAGGPFAGIVAWAVAEIGRLEGRIQSLEGGKVSPSGSKTTPSGSGVTTTTTTNTTTDGASEASTAPNRPSVSEAPGTSPSLSAASTAAPEHHGGPHHTPEPAPVASSESGLGSKE
jgi:hypothetical protein